MYEYQISINKVINRAENYNMPFALKGIMQ